MLLSILKLADLLFDQFIALANSVIAMVRTCPPEMSVLSLLTTCHANLTCQKQSMASGNTCGTFLLSISKSS
jgi:hypothetical protein